MAKNSSTDNKISGMNTHYHFNESMTKQGIESRQINYPETAPGHGMHESPNEPSLRDLPAIVWNIPRFIVLGFIRLYQVTFSRTLPQGTCRFYPSCSHFGFQAIYKYGVIKGGVIAAWRVLRCNPFNPGGFDPVP